MKQYSLVFPLSLLILLSTAQSFAQDTTSLRTKFERYEGVESSVVSNKGKNFSQEILFQPIMLTLFFSNSRYVDLIRKLPGSASSTNVTIEERTQVVQFFGFGYGARYNLLNGRESAFGVKADVSLALSLVFSEAAHLPRAAFGSATYGAFLYFAHGLGGSFSSLSKRGFSLSAGFVGIKAPLLSFSPKKTLSYTYELQDPNDKWRLSHWLLPSFTVDYIFSDSFERLPFISLRFATLNKNYFVQASFGLRFK